MWMESMHMQLSAIKKQYNKSYEWSYIAGIQNTQRAIYNVKDQEQLIMKLLLLVANILEHIMFKFQVDTMNVWM